MIGQQLTSLGISFFATWLIWLAYRRARFPLARKYATFWPRFWTEWVDGCVLGPLGFVVSLLLLLHLPPIVSVLVSLVSNTAALTYTVWMHACCGQTVGKMVCKVRVVDHLTEGPISIQQAVLRECVPMIASVGMIGYSIYLQASGQLAALATGRPDLPMNWQVFGLLAATPAAWFLVEVVTMFSNRKRRALHDLIAGTVVVRTHLDETHPSVLEPNQHPTAPTNVSRPAQA